MRIFFLLIFSLYSSYGFSIDMDNIFEKLSEIKSVKADFYQETTIANFGTDAYTGIITLLAGEKVLWNYTSPYKQYYFFTKDTMEYYDSATEQFIRQKVTSSGSNNIVFQILIDLNEAKKTFNFTSIDENSVKLEPKTDIGLKYLILQFSDIYIKKIVSEDLNGNKTEITFNNVILNPKLTESDFNRDIPPGTEIFNY
jgi:outer membrane lipoprotein carrier protein